MTRPLGRLVRHDERSRAYPAMRSSAIVTTVHQRRAPILDQGDVGSCTGNALAGLLGTEPFATARDVDVDEALALDIYSRATHLDRVRGVYPPTDTGSSGLAVAKAAKQMGLVSAYRHAFGLAHALGALVVAPVIIGIDWFSSFDDPGPHGLLTITYGATVRGGHEVVLDRVDTVAGTVGGANSWGPGWGDHGRFTMTWATLGALLQRDGDVTAIDP